MLEFIFELVVDGIFHLIYLNKIVRFSIGLLLFALAIFAYINSKKDAFYITTGIFIAYVLYFTLIHFWYKNKKKN
jgi:hypothetical protein